MATESPLASATTTTAVAATAQSRDDGKAPAAFNRDDCTGAGSLYDLGAAFRRVSSAPHRHKKGEPLYRPLRIYTVDPAARRLEGAIGTINVPYEPLEPGPAGCLFVVDNVDGNLGDGVQVHYRH